MSSVIHKIACLQNRRDEIPNQELARELADSEDREGIQEIADNLRNQDVNIQSDCVKVLYEVGYLKPHLIANFAVDFIRLLRSRHNRLVWGGMLALSTIAGVSADVIYPHIAEIQKAMGHGSVITVDAGVLTLATLALSNDDRRREIFPYLLLHLQTCRPKDVPQHAEKIVLAVNSDYKRPFVEALERRMEDMSSVQARRVKKVIRDAEKR